jgi:hypothetical protein
MNFQIKLFTWPERGNHIILIARGLVDTNACSESFRKIGEMVRPLRDCKVLVDLADAKCSLSRTEVQDFVNGLRPGMYPQVSRIALVSPSDTDQYDQLQMLCDCLSKREFNIAAFYNTKIAVEWLADQT